MKWVRDFNELSKPKKLIVGSVGTVIGSFLIVLGNLSLGIPLETSIRDLLIMVVASFGFAFVWAVIVKRRKKKEQ